MEFKAALCHPSETERVLAVAQQAAITEEIEQRRRMLDKAGEKQRMWNGNKVAQIFRFTENKSLKHVPYPVNVPLFERQKSAGWSAVSNALHAASNLTSSVTQATADAAEATIQKTADLASSVSHATADAAGATTSSLSSLGHKTADIASSLSQKTADIASSFSHAAAGIASSISHAASDLASTIPQKSAETAALVKQKTHEAAEAASAVAAVVLPKAAEVAHEAKMRLVQVADDISYSTTRRYARALQEVERRRRMVDLDEQYAILNGLQASSLLKGLGPEYYRQFDKKFLYSFTLLEELERRWRSSPIHTATALANAKHESSLIAIKFALSITDHQEKPLPAANFVKVELPDSSVFVTPRAYTPAL